MSESTNTLNMQHIPESIEDNKIIAIDDVRRYQIQRAAAHAALCSDGVQASLRYAVERQVARQQVEET